MKKAFVILSLLAMAIFAYGVAAATNSIEDVDDGSTATISSDNDSSAKVWTSNKAFVWNSVSSTSDSGNNSVSSNDEQEDVTVTTGNAVALAGVGNVVNTTFVDVDVVGCGCDEGDNSITDIDDESNATIESDNDTRARVGTRNKAFVGNNVDATADTGGNSVSADDDQTGVDVTTGTALSGILVDSLVNYVDVIMTVSPLP